MVKGSRITSQMTLDRHRDRTVRAGDRRVTGSVEDPDPSVTGGLGCLTGQAGLSHAGVAAEHDHLGQILSSGVRDRSIDRFEFASATRQLRRGLEPREVRCNRMRLLFGFRSCGGVNPGWWLWNGSSTGTGLVVRGGCS